MQRLMPFISVAILMGFAIVHGIRRYGWRHFVVFFIVAFVISWSYETLSILTGFPFGHYVYTDKLGPKLWHAVIQSVAPALGMEVRAIKLRDPAETERAVAAFARSSNGSLIVSANWPIPAIIAGFKVLRYSSPSG